MKKCISCRLTPKPSHILHLFWFVNGDWSVQISLLIQTRSLFHWNKCCYRLWTHLKNILMLDLFQLLSSPDVNWWTGVVWIIVMFLSDSHSDGTHSLQSIHCWASATFLQIWCRNKLIFILDGLRVFWVNYPFTSDVSSKTQCSLVKAAVSDIDVMAVFPQKTSWEVSI